MCSFVKHFYEVLSHKPDELYKFYLQDASFAHCESDDVSESDSLQGLDAIKQRINQLQLKGLVVNYAQTCVDAQKAGYGSNHILIMVTGSYFRPSSESRPFVQTFLLVGQVSQSSP
jgi:hypothetical protein